MNLSPHFTLEEFTFSETAVRKNIANIPTLEIIENLRIVASKMEIIRQNLGHPIISLSGYRSPIVNKLVGGSVNSAHCLGWSLDFICPAFGTPYTVARRISGMGLIFDQLIHEYGRWVHISFDPQARKKRLTIAGKGTGYVDGILPVNSYTEVKS